MDISKFKSSFTNFLRPNLYRVEFDFKKFNPSKYADMEKVSMLCKDAAFPFFTFNLTESFYNGKKHFTAQEIDFDPVNLVFMVDSDGNVLNFLTAWKNQIVDANHNYGFRDDYIATVTISMLDQTSSSLIQSALTTTSKYDDEIASVVRTAKYIEDEISRYTSVLRDLEDMSSDVATVKLHNAFIVNIDEMPLGYGNNDQISEVSVSLNFDYAEYNLDKQMTTETDIFTSVVSQAETIINDVTNVFNF